LLIDAGRWLVSGGQGPDEMQGSSIATQHQSHDPAADRAPEAEVTRAYRVGLGMLHGNILCKAEKASLIDQSDGVVSRRMSEVACYGREENKMVDASRRH
jgi:hypothetical protein